MADGNLTHLTTCGIDGYRLRRELPFRYYFNIGSADGDYLIVWIDDVPIHGRVPLRTAGAPFYAPPGVCDYGQQAGDGLRVLLGVARDYVRRGEAPESIIAFFREWLVPIEGVNPR